MKNNEQVYWEDLSDEKLQALHTKQLINLKNGMKALHTQHAMYTGHRCCEICNEYVGPDWDAEVKPRLDELKAYMTRIKAVLATREHIPNKQEAKAIRKEKAKFKNNR
jgi:hypothetical protein